MTTPPEQPQPLAAPLSRRRLVRGTAMAGTALAAGTTLGACTAPTPPTSAPTPHFSRGPSVLPEFGSAPPTTPEGTRTTPGTTPGTQPGTQQPATSPGTQPPVTLNDSSVPSLVVGKTSAIPVGGGVIFPQRGVVVTQPTTGKFKCFSSSCTHQGCTVNKIADGLIQCPCHGAKFSIADGSVKAGPAPRPLTPQQITIQNGRIVLS